MQTTTETAVQAINLPPAVASSIFPVELEIEILHYTILPEVIFNEHILPQQFFLYCQALVHEQVEIFAGAARARQKRLRMVCRRWKDIADNILPRWEYRVRGLDRSRVPSCLAATPPNDNPYYYNSYNYKKFVDEELHDFLTVHHQDTIVTYNRPIRTFRLDTDQWMEKTRGFVVEPEFLEKFIQYPAELRALHLKFWNQTTYNIFSYIQNSLRNITTLSLFVGSMQLNNYLSASPPTISLPRLSTLMTWTTLLVSKDSTASIRWDLPRLKNLSCKSRPLTRDADGILKEISTNISKEISALYLAEWSFIETTESPVLIDFCQYFPRLELLGADLSQIRPLPQQSGPLLPAGAASTRNTILHLIPTISPYRRKGGTMSAVERNTLEGLEMMIESCPCLLTVTLPRVWLNGRIRGQFQQAEMVEGVRQLCHSRGVKLIDVLGNDVDERQ